jgi:hypothetical protein
MPAYADSEQKRSDDEKDVSKGEELLVKRWTEIIDDLEEDHLEHFKVIDNNRKIVIGNKHRKEDEGTVRVNLTHAHVKKAVNRSYARNPEFSIRPTRFVNPSSMPMWRMFGQTAEIVLNRALKAADFKRRAKSCLRAAKTSRIGWLKVRWQQEVKTDGMVKNEIRDTQSKLAHLKSLEYKIENDEDRQNHEGLKMELEELLETLESQEEFVALQGLVFDVVSPKNMLIPFKGIENFDEYVNTGYMIERMWKTKQEAEERYGKSMPEGTQYYKEKEDGSHVNVKNKSERQGGEDCDFVLLYEIWDAENGRVKILAHGGKRFIENFVPKKLGLRWFPYFALAQNPVDGQFFPLSDVELISELAEEINNSLTKLRDHRDICVPHWVGDSSIVKKKDINAYKHATLGEIVLVEGQPGKRISDVFEPAKHPVIDPSVYTTAHLERAIEQVAGGGDVTNPKSNRSRTLGEAQALAADTNVDITSDTEEMEDWFQDIAEYVLEILLQRLSIEDVIGIAGPAMEKEKDPETGQETGKLIDGSFWPASAPDDVFNNVHFVVKAGSSGKPGKDQEVSVWTQFIMPRMVDLLKQVAELRSAGMHPEAESLIFIAKETLRRVDPFFDISEFIPPPAPPNPEKQAEQAQVQEERSLQLKLLNVQIEKHQAETARILADKTIKELELSKIQSDMRLTDEKIESMNIDDAIKGVMAKMETRLKQVEADLKNREINLKEQELAIKRRESDNRAFIKPNGGN